MLPIVQGKRLTEPAAHALKVRGLPHCRCPYCFRPARQPVEDCYCESFNSKLREELLTGEIFYSLAAARIVVETWRHH
ncbi:hypothetical protein CESP606_17600 [Cereibacter sphaeroides]|nr:hypothetical protein RSP03_42580 [Cereibacter sphaeroides]